MKKALVGVLAVVLVVGGYALHRQSKQSELMATLTPHVKNASIRTENAVRLITASSNVTFKELFEKLDADIAEIDKRVIEVQSISSAENANSVAPTVSYLQSAQEFSRSIVMNYRKEFAVSNAIDRAKDAMREARSSTGYSFDYAKKRADQAMEDLDEAQKKSTESASDVVTAAENFKKARIDASKIFPNDSLISTEKLDAVIKKYKTEKSAEISK